MLAGTPKAHKNRKTKLAPVWPCVRFWGQGRETDTSEAPEALLGQGNPVVNERGKPNKPKTDDTQPLPLKGEG